MNNLQVMSKYDHMSLHMKERWQNGETNNEKLKKRVMKMLTGEIFDSVRGAARELGIDSTRISRLCRKHVRCCGSYWKYV